MLHRYDRNNRHLLNSEVVTNPGLGLLPRGVAVDNFRFVNRAKGVAANPASSCGATRIPVAPSHTFMDTADIRCNDRQAQQTRLQNHAGNAFYQ